VTGIDPAANLNPSNTTAFVTALTFTGSGVFSGTQTPIVTNFNNSVPLPASAVLLGLGLVGIFGIKRKHQR
jgi:PEP-CTERM motif